MTKRRARRPIANFEAKSVALFLTLTLGSAMATHAQTGAASPFVIGGTKSQPAAGSATGKTTAAPSAKDADKAKDAAKDAAKAEEKKDDAKLTSKANPPELGKGESVPKPKADGAKY